MGWVMPVPVAVGVLAVAAGAVVVFGKRLSEVVDRIADRTGVGEAIAGAVLLAAATSLAGFVTSVVAAASGDARLAVSNSVGGIAAQTTFLVAADVVYRGANLEHAAASITNVFSSLLMMTMLGVVVLGVALPDITVLNVHPVTFLLVLVYGYGLLLGRKISREPMWHPEVTSKTRMDEPEPSAVRSSLGVMWLQLALFGVAVSLAGYAVARAGLSLAGASGLSSTFIGAFLTSIVTSMPELVTTIAAVRAGALTMAVGGIVGGNAFDVMFVAASDIAYQEGAIYGGVGQSDLFLIALTILLVGTATAGLVRREPGGIGFEGYAIPAFYVAGIVVIAIAS